MLISPLINLFGLVLVLPFGLWQLRGFELGEITSGMWALLGYCAIAASVLSTWLWLTGLKHVPAAIPASDMPRLEVSLAASCSSRLLPPTP